MRLIWEERWAWASLSDWGYEVPPVPKNLRSQVPALGYRALSWHYGFSKNRVFMILVDVGQPLRQTGPSLICNA